MEDLDSRLLPLFQERIFLTVSNYIFTAIFVGEMTLKVVGFTCILPTPTWSPWLRPHPSCRPGTQQHSTGPRGPSCWALDPGRSSAMRGDQCLPLLQLLNPA